MIPVHSVRGRRILAIMAALQALWLVGIWQTGAAASAWKLPSLLGYSLLCPLLVASVPTACFTTTATVGWIESRVFLPFALVFVALIGGLYAYQQRGWPDEVLVLAAAQRVAEQGVASFFAHYVEIPWLGTQHPPLAVLIYGGALRLFGPHLFVLRLVALAFSLGILILTYRIGCLLYDRTTGAWAAGALLVTPFWSRIGTTALNDVPLTFCFALAVFLTLRLVATPSYGRAFGVGLCIGAGLLCKYTMVLVYPVVLMVVILHGQWQRLFPYLVVVVLVSGAVFTVWVGYAVHLGVFDAHRTVLGKHVSYVVAGRTGRSWLLGVLLFRLPSGIGISLLPLLLLGGWQLLQRRNRADCFVLLWMTAVCLPLILTMPGPRYFFPAFPASAIMIAHGVNSLGEGKDRVVSLVLCYWGAALYLFVDWGRAAGGLFSH